VEIDVDGGENTDGWGTPACVNVGADSGEAVGALNTVFDRGWGAGVVSMAAAGSTTGAGATMTGGGSFGVGGAATGLRMGRSGD
jgi:hypothetical protein